MEILRAQLPHPPGINRTYKTGQGRFYKDGRAHNWAQDAVLMLRAAGFRPVRPDTLHWVAVEIDVHTARADFDAGIKAAVDAIATALQINDRWFGALAVRKFQTERAQQRLEVYCQLVDIREESDFNSLSKVWASSSYAGSRAEE